MLQFSIPVRKRQHWLQNKNRTNKTNSKSVACVQQRKNNKFYLSLSVRGTEMGQKEVAKARELGTSTTAVTLADWGRECVATGTLTVGMPADTLGSEPPRNEPSVWPVLTRSTFSDDDGLPSVGCTYNVASVLQPTDFSHLEIQIFRF